MKQILEPLIRSIEQLHELLEDGVCSDSCGQLRESKAMLVVAKENLAKYMASVEAGICTNPTPKWAAIKWTPMDSAPTSEGREE